MRKQVIRIGDQVKVINPEFVQAWGYENNFAEELAKAEADEELAYKISHFVNKVFNAEDTTFALPGRPRHFMNVDRKILHAIAYGRVGEKIKDGNKKVLTRYRHIPEIWENRAAEVTDKKMVKTGTYFPPGSSYDSYYHEYEFIPGGLTDEKTHVLLHINDSYWIEACNVEKVK